jgi:hypothetical protein
VGVIPRIAVFDSLTPLVRRWSEQLSPGVVRAWRRAAIRGRLEARASADRFLSRRTGAGRRGIRARVRKTPTGLVAEIWPSVGYLAAHELGSTIPAVTIQPRSGGSGVLRYMVGGAPRFARFTRRPAFTLPRRPWASAAVPAIERAAVETLDAEMAKVFEVPGFTGGGRG